MAHENETVEEAVRWFETVRAERTLPLSFLGFGGADDFYGGILAREITKLRASAPKVWDAGSEYDKMRGLLVRFVALLGAWDHKALIDAATEARDILNQPPDGGGA